jgi:hypothetical protein
MKSTATALLMLLLAASCEAVDTRSGALLLCFTGLPLACCGADVHGKGESSGPGDMSADPAVNSTTGYIIGGVSTSIIAFPFTVSIQSVDSSDYSIAHVCGGSIIGPRLVLTSAVCVRGRAVRLAAVSTRTVIAVTTDYLASDRVCAGV